MENRKNAAAGVFQESFVPRGVDGVAHRTLDRTGGCAAGLGDIRVNDLGDADLNGSDQSLCAGKARPEGVQPVYLPG